MRTDWLGNQHNAFLAGEGDHTGVRVNRGDGGIGGYPLNDIIIQVTQVFTVRMILSVILNYGPNSESIAFSIFLANAVPPQKSLIALPR